MLKKDGLIIKLMERADIEFARVLHNDPETVKYLTDPEHVSELQQEKWFESMSLSKTSKRYVVFTEGLDPVGVVRIDNIDWKNKNVMIGLDIALNHRGKGYASKTYSMMLDYYFKDCGMHRIYLYVLDNNPRAKHIYEKIGFLEEGRMRECVYRDGKYMDYILMGIFNPHEQ